MSGPSQEREAQSASADFVVIVAPTEPREAEVYDVTGVTLRGESTRRTAFPCIHRGETRTGIDIG